MSRFVRLALLLIAIVLIQTTILPYLRVFGDHAASNPSGVMTKRPLTIGDGTILTTPPHKRMGD